MRECTICGKEKPHTAEYFYRDKSRKSGLLERCKVCDNEKNRRRQRKYPVYHHAWEKRPHETDEQYEERRRIEQQEMKEKRKIKYRDYYRQKSLKYNRDNKEKADFSAKVRYQVRKAIRKGILVRPSTCEWCGEEHKHIDAAHHDYSKPLDIKWLCRSCHNKWDYYEPKLMKKN